MHPFSFDMVGPTSSTFLVREKFSPLNELIFIEGGLGMIWSAVWLFFASDTPVGNKHISETEREYIRTCKAEEKIQDTRTVSQIRFLVSKIFFEIIPENTMGSHAEITRILVYLSIYGHLRFWSLW